MNINNLENQHMIKHFINILNLMGVYLKLEYSNNKIKIKDISFTQQFYNEYNVINEPSFEIINSLFRIELDTHIRFEKDNICEFEKKALKNNPHYDTDLIESLYVEYQDELDEREREFTSDIEKEININLGYLKEAIDKYLEELNNGTA